MTDLKRLIRTIPDHPKPGIMFRDVTTLFGDAQGFKALIAQLTEPYRTEPLGCGFIPIRKKGKLPWKVFAQEYALEYGTDTVEMHQDALDRGRRVLIVDDLIATGGTADAAGKLILRAGGEIVGACFIIDLPALGGADLLRGQGINVRSLMHFDGH